MKEEQQPDELVTLRIHSGVAVYKATNSHVIKTWRSSATENYEVQARIGLSVLFIVIK